MYSYQRTNVVNGGRRDALKNLYSVPDLLFIMTSLENIQNPSVIFKGCENLGNTPTHKLTTQAG